jgi:hypothetical protein
VLFDRICRENGIEHLLTKPRSPTTTGKIERWHQSIQTEFLDELPAFVSLEAAQAAVDAWRVEYNTTRPHQSLDMASPADRFRPAPPSELPVWLPADLAPVPEPPRAPLPDTTPPPAMASVVTVPGSGDVQWPDAVEVDRVVPASGNLQVAGQQFWLGAHRAGQPVTLWIDTTTVHVAVAEQHLKTVPSRLSTVDLARLRTDGAVSPGRHRPDRRPDCSPPGPPSSWIGWCTPRARLCSRTGRPSSGCHWPAGWSLCGSNPICCTSSSTGSCGALPVTLTSDQRAGLRGARIAGPPPALPDTPVRVHRRVSSRGGIQVVGQRVQVGFRHAGATITIEVDDTVLRVLDQHDEIITVVARTTRKEVSRYKAYGHTNRAQA